jgi:hypothetical protein
MNREFGIWMALNILFSHFILASFKMSESNFCQYNVLAFSCKKTILIFPDFLFAVCKVSLRRNE